MAEYHLDFRVLATGWAEAGEAMCKLSVFVARFSDALIDALDPLWAILPGEWPDNFILLNRYLRTGTRPPFLFNE